MLSKLIIVQLKQDILLLSITGLQELREDNALMTETKNILEDQLSNFQGRFENIAEIEADLLKYKQQLENVILVNLYFFP